jgi:hypothetical protein
MWNFFPFEFAFSVLLFNFIPYVDSGKLFDNSSSFFHMGIWASRGSMKFCKLSLFTFVLNSKFTFDLIGYGMEHKNAYQFKIPSAIAYLRSLPRDDIVVLFDGFDILLQVSAEEIYDRYVELGMPNIIISVEENCSLMTRTDDCKNFSQNPHGFPAKFLNSGSLIGRAGHLLDMYLNIMSDKYYENYLPGLYHEDDQKFVIYAFFHLKESLGIQLDYKSLFFLATFGSAVSICYDSKPISAVYEDSIGKFYIKPYNYTFMTGLVPALLHFNSLHRHGHLFNCMVNRGYLVDSLPHKDLTRNVLNSPFRLFPERKIVTYREFCRPFAERDQVYLRLLTASELPTAAGNNQQSTVLKDY